MALPTNQITAITHRYIIPKVQDNVYGSNSALARFNRPSKKMIISGGSDIQAPVYSSSNTSGGWFSGYENLDTTETDNISSATFNWKEAYEAIRISQLDEAKSNGEAAAVRLIFAKAKLGEMAMRDRLVGGIFSDGATGVGGTKEILGLQATLSATSTYGSIAVADLPSWAAQVADNGGTNRALTMNLLQASHGAATFDDEHPTVYYMKQSIYDVLWGLFQPFQRLAGSAEMAKLGFENVIELNGVPCLVDSHMLANNIFGVNENMVKLAVHKNYDMIMDNLDKVEGSATSLGRIFWKGNLVCHGRRYNFKLADLLTS